MGNVVMVKGQNLPISAVIRLGAENTAPAAWG